MTRKSYITFPAQENEIEEITSVAEELFPQEYNFKLRQRSFDFFSGILNSPFDRLYSIALCWDDFHDQPASIPGETVSGFAIYRPQGLTGTHELFQIGVRKKDQGRGVGTTLLRESMDRYEREMKDLGLDMYAIYLATAFDNPVAQNLYRKCGFEITGTISDSYIGLGDRQVLMTKVFDRTRKYEPGTLWTPDKK